MRPAAFRPLLTEGLALSANLISNEILDHSTKKGDYVKGKRQIAEIISNSVK